MYEGAVGGDLSAIQWSYRGAEGILIGQDAFFFRRKETI